MRDELAKARGFTGRGETAPGVPKQQLLDAMVILGGMDRTEATTRVDEQRLQNELSLYPFQNPNAEVQLSTELGKEKAAPKREGTETARSTEFRLPPLIDIRDDLQYLQNHTNEETQEHIREIEATLIRVAEHNMTKQERFLDEIDNNLLRIQFQVESNEQTIRHVRSARNRIDIYRHTLANTSDNLAVVDPGIRHAHTGHRATVAALQGIEAEIKALVLNEGDQRNAILIITFYNSNYEKLSKARSARTGLTSGSEQVVTIPVQVPLTAVSYTVTVLDIEDYLIEYQFQQ